MKRLIDIFFSLILLLATSPIIIAVSIMIFFKLGTPVFFKQYRPGKNGKPFQMLKFRTLTNETDSNGVVLPENQRLTKFGSLLRKMSIDELPELINVLRGEMSLVGPRPLRMYYLPLYDDLQMRRHDVKPGITGWAQINGRNALSWERKFEMDIWYVENMSIMLDLKILFLTISKVINQKDITASDGGFTEPFRGSGKKMISHEEVQNLKQKLG
jgi:sugar transferase EpsL